MQIRLSSDGYEVIDSKQVFLFGKDKDLHMEVDTEDDFVFSIELRFYDTSSGKREIKQEVNDHQILLSCYNFEEMGAGLKAPVEIATVKGRKLYFFFWSDLISGNARKVSYTIFYEKQQME